MSCKRRLALLDRDGTLIRHVHYLSDPAGVELLPEVAPSLRQLQKQGYGLVLISNQSGVGRGYFSAAQLEAVNARMLDLLAEQGVQLDLVLCCPHAPDDRCPCRKPAPGLAWRAAAELGADLSQSLVIGDSDCDMGLAEAVGATGFRLHGATPPGQVAVKSLAEVVSWLAASGQLDQL